MTQNTSKRIPKYRKQKRRGRDDLAFIEAGGRRVYLGAHGSPESRKAYGRLVAEMEASRGRLPVDEEELTITELAAAYWRHSETYYQGPDGAPTSELGWIKLSLRPLRTLYGPMLARDFGPLKLKAVRARMITGGVTRKAVNSRVGRIKRMFRWATENELVPPGVHEALRAVAGLRANRSDAKESPPVRAVPLNDATAVLPYVSAPVRAMIELQLATGMRPGEARTIQGVELNTSGELWEYRPRCHKTAHHGHERVIMLGPHSQEIVAPFLRPGYLFSPLDVPGCPCVQPAYTKDAYIRAVARGCRRAGVTSWSPNQLRHTSGTMIRKEAGLEGAQAWLGHKHARTSEIYAETSQSLVRQLAVKYG